MRYSDAEITAIRAQWKRRTGRDEVPMYATKPRPFILSRSVGIDATDRIWVRRTVAAGHPATFDIFANTGRDSVQLDIPVRQMRLLADQLLVITEDSTGMAQAIRYQVK